MSEPEQAPAAKRPRGEAPQQATAGAALLQLLAEHLLTAPGRGSADASSGGGGGDA